MKVGDWVRNTEGFLFRVTENNMHASDDFTLWMPKEGEWCWFNTTTKTLPFIAKYGELNYEKYFVNNDTFIDKVYIESIEPFIGELPSFIKDKQ